MNTKQRDLIPLFLHFSIFTPLCILFSGYPNVVYPRRGKTRQSAPNVCARRLGQDEQYLTVREILSEASTLTDGALSRERSDFYRFGYATLGFTKASTK